jgi:hypothetical protein
MDGDYGNAELRPMARGVLKYFLHHHLMLVLLQMSSNWLIKIN